MEPVGSHYSILLHDPQLRQVLVDEAPGPRWAVRLSRSFRWLRVRVAQMLVGLAAYIEPGALVRIATTGSEAVPGH
jgi:hypothetical protein